MLFVRVRMCVGIGLGSVRGPTRVGDADAVAARCPAAARNSSIEFAVEPLLANLLTLALGDGVAMPAESPRLRKIARPSRRKPRASALRPSPTTATVPRPGDVAVTGSCHAGGGGRGGGGGRIVLVVSHRADRARRKTARTPAPGPAHIGADAAAAGVDHAPSTTATRATSSSARSRPGDTPR